MFNRFRGHRRPVLANLAAAIVAFAFAAPGCNEVPRPVIPQPPPEVPPPEPAAEPVPTPSSQPLTEVGKAIVRQLQAGDVATVYARFSDELKEALTADQLRGIWEGLQAKLGPLQEERGAKEQEVEGYRVVRVTCRFENATMDVRLVFDAGRQLSGIQVVPPLAAVERPQHPQPPFPYVAEEVTFDNPTDAATISGTLTLPRGEGPFPAVVLITGSGSQDRDETIFGHKPFLVLADHLTRNGFAVLRTDDRGVGKSTGDPTLATIEVHGTDVDAALAFLGADRRIDPKRRGLVGHSEGGIVASYVASRSKDVAFVVSLAGTGLPGSEINPMQVGAILTAKGLAPAGVKKIVDAQRKIMNLVARDAPAADVRQAVREALIEATRIAGAEADPIALDAQVEVEASTVLSPWFRSFVKLDPATTWSKVRVPVLALIGDKDTQVPADPNLAAIEAALRKAGNRDATVKKMPALNHLFQTASTGLLDEYGQLTETFAPAALTVVTDWLKARGKP